MNQEFVGRRRELALIEAELAKSKMSLIIAYGRRRVGKSRLLREATKDRTRVLYQATRVTSGLNLESFKREIAGSLGGSPVLEGLSDWEPVFHYLADCAANAHPGLTVVIDEFPYIADADRALPSILQRFIDSGAPQRGNLKLILCGSAISQMEELFVERSPLYGRKTMTLAVKPLPLRDATRFFPDYGVEDKLKAYAVFGGIPFYLQLCDRDVSLRDNITRLLLTETGALVDEPNVLLQSELNEPKVYSSILAALADGCVTAKEMADRLRVDPKDTGPYLAKLERLDLVLSRRSLDADPRARNIRFAINEPLIAFWHNFVRPNLTAIAGGYGRRVYDTVVERDFSAFMGKAFESVCLAHAALHIEEELGYPAQEVGGIWGHANFDIDVAGRLIDQTYFYGECKWRSAPVNLGMVEKLMESAEATPFGRGRSGKQYLFFSRAGFKPEVSALARTDASVHLIGLDALVSAPDHPFEDTPSFS